MDSTGKSKFLSVFYAKSRRYRPLLIKSVYITMIICGIFVIVPIITDYLSPRVTMKWTYYAYNNILNVDERVSIVHEDKDKNTDLQHSSTGNGWHQMNETAVDTTEMKKNNKSKYITLCLDRLYGNHRTGNHIFMLAALLHVAELTGRKLIMPRTGWKLDKTFDMDIERYDNISYICPCRGYKNPHYSFDSRLNNSEFVNDLRNWDETILLCGLSQTSVYASKVETELRRKLKFKREDLDFAKNFGEFHQSNWLWFKYQQVGVHIRGGDFKSEGETNYGLTVINSTYLENAFEYFTSTRKRTQFIVATDDWKFANLLLQNLTEKYNIIRSLNHTAEHDFALLSSCDAVIMSTGSFGWWAGWISKRTTVYYAHWPEPNTPLFYLMDKKTYFPTSWVPLL